VKVLVADDSEINLMLISLVLKEQGHEIITVTNGQEAIEVFKRRRPDLVIMDVVMEGMDGFECARTMRSIRRDDWIPIIFLSNSVDDSSLAKGIDAGGDDYLAKPFSKITLIAKIKAMQRISDMRQKLYRTTQKLEVFSATDALTGIYNRFQFDKSIVEKLSMANRYHRQLALLFIDLDNFKIINDTFGHHVGDLLLKEVATRLKSCLRTEDFLARVGGDEFAVILSDIDNPLIAGVIAQKILDSLTPDYHLDENKIRTSASIGIALYPSSETTQMTLIQNADVAMYHAKELGRNSYQYYSANLNEKYKQHIHLEQALQFALEKNQFYLKYQPIMDLQKRQVIGLETLLCWDHPEYGAVSPVDFIPIAEEMGLIVPIGYWIMRQACEHAVQWGLEEIDNFKLGINISSHQLLQEDFYQNTVDILNDTNVSPTLLEFEITETTEMDYADFTLRQTITKLHDLGITISIDDFGTGYSSLTRLKDLAIDTLKIDQIFVQDAIKDYNAGIIVKNLINMCKELKLDVIAEGIETQEQLDFLLAHGCIHGQGYLLARPLFIEQVKGLLLSGTKE
jgi:diguanylate cyclase (GGDEF)-like protein